jgi:hypothetical protein
MRHEKNVKGIAFLEAILMPLPDWQAFAPEMQKMFQAFRWKNLKRLKAVYVGDGIHYLQEDHPHEIGAAIADCYAAL